MLCLADLEAVQTGLALEAWGQGSSVGVGIALATAFYASHPGLGPGFLLFPDSALEGMAG